VKVARRWIVRQSDPQRVEELVKALDLPKTVARVLVNRGIEDASAAERFLAPALRDLYAPDGLADLDPAVQRIVAAVDRREIILVYGDYDADGVTSAALLLSFLREMGAEVRVVIPHRERDGYGLSLPLLQRARKEGVGLIITVDCGTTDHAEIAAAHQMGMDVIVTDHHEVPQALPPALAVINPKRADNRYSFADLAGVGVAFLLLWGVAGVLKARGFWPSGQEPSLKQYLDLVALGTIADQAPLLGENRTLVKHGLVQIATKCRPGLQALLEVSGLYGRPPTVGSLVYQVAPRINAAGRMDEALPALELLLCDDLDRGRELAGVLDGLNRERQGEEERIFREASALAEQEVRSGKRALVLSRPDWHPGVIGIVASRLVDRYGLPAVLVGVKDGIGRGSARSPEGYDLMRSLRTCSDFMVRFGGHRQAAGLRIDPAMLTAFRQAFCDEALRVMAGALPGPILPIDDCLAPSQVTEDLIRHLARLEPHGVGNPEPVFQMDRFEVNKCRKVGQDHLKLWVCQEGVGFDAIGFGMGNTFDEAFRGTVRLACLPRLNEWQGKTSIQLKVRDLQLA
jgi:single-stranded-DNA-specific exonuclease